jgi:TolB protein
MKSIVKIIIVSCSYFSFASPRIINLNSPEFRPLNVSTSFVVKKSKRKSFLDIIEQHGRRELHHLLDFTTIFKALDTSATSIGIVKKISDTIIRVDLSYVKNNYIVLIKTTDLNQKRVVLKKKYSFKKVQGFNAVAKKYVDSLLEAYTGKPGIFSSKIVFVGKRTKSSLKQIFVSNIDGSSVKQLTRGNFIHLSPSWNLEANNIVYTSYKRGKPDLYLYDFDRGKHKLLSKRYSLNSGGSFLPSGGAVAFTGANGSNTNIFMLNIRNNKYTTLTRGRGIDVDPTFSPNGKWLAFVSERYGKPNIIRGELVWNKNKTRISLKNYKRLTYKGWYNTTPSWSPDSKKIAFSSYDNDMRRFDIYSVNYDGSDLERLTLKSGDNENPTWSPNGQLIMFNSTRIKGRDVKGPSQMHIMNKDGSNFRKIDVGLYEAYAPKWSSNNVL